MFILKLLERLFIIIFLIFFISGCSRRTQPEIVDAKVIEYKVEYVDEVAGSIPTSILPRKMTLIFAEKMAMNTIDGFLGQFTLTYIADLKKETVVTMLKLFDKRYYHRGESGENPAGIAPMDGMKLEGTDSTARILDFDARRYILYIPGYEEKEIWSTPDIKIKNPNITTPYKELEDVLLQFYTELSVLKMNMMAHNFEEQSLSNEIFQVPEKYEEISRKKMEKILEELFK
jgi:hypothetical protein